MKKCFTALLLVLVVTTVAVSQRTPSNPTGLIGPIGLGGPDGGGGLPLFDDLESLMLGPLNGQLSAPGVEYFAFELTTTVETDSTNQFIRQENTFADDLFVDEIEAYWDGVVTPAADDGFTITHDYELSDLNTDRFYRWTSVVGTFFAVVGDPDGNGTFDVLEGDGMGDASFFDTGVQIPLAANLGISVADEALTVVLNGSAIYSGQILGANDAGIDTPELSTGILFPSANNADGFGSLQLVDNISIVPEPSSLLLVLAGLGVLRRRN